MNRLFIFLLLLTSVVLAESSSEKMDASSKGIVALPRPHDHTGTALDIMVKKDVIRADYGQQLYHRYCASCHGSHRRGSATSPELSARTLAHYSTISDLYLNIKNAQRAVPPTGVC